MQNKFETLKLVIATVNERIDDASESLVESIFTSTEQLINERLDAVTDRDEALVADVRDFAIANAIDSCDIRTLSDYYAVSDTLETFIDLLASSYVDDQRHVLYSKASTMRKLFVEVCERWTRA